MGIFKRKKGFTLIELLVSITIFSVVVSVASVLFANGIVAQKRSLAYEQLENQISYAAEYISRSGRMAKKELFDHTYDCLATRGDNFENPGGNQSSLAFIKYDDISTHDICYEFFLQNGQIEESTKDLTTGTSTTQPLTSPNLDVKSLIFRLSGQSQNDNLQPKVTMFMDVSSVSNKPEEVVSLKLQTTISQRDLDVMR